MVLPVSTQTPGADSTHPDARRAVNDVVIRLAGNSQDGIQTIGGFLARLAEKHARDRARRASSPAPVQENLLAALARATVRVEAVLQGASVRMGDLVAMRQGQILLLGTPPGSPFDCLVNGKAQFKGEMVAAGNRQGFQIE